MRTEGISEGEGASRKAPSQPVLNQPNNRVFKRRNAISLPEGASLLPHELVDDSDLELPPSPQPAETALPLRRPSKLVDLRGISPSEPSVPSSPAVRIESAPLPGSVPSPASSPAAKPNAEASHGRQASRSHFSFLFGSPAAPASSESPVPASDPARSLSHLPVPLPPHCRNGRRGAICSLPDTRDRTGRRHAICDSLFTPAVPASLHTASVQPQQLRSNFLEVNESSGVASPTEPLSTSELDECASTEGMALPAALPSNPSANMVITATPIVAIEALPEPEPARVLPTVEQLASLEFCPLDLTDEELIECAVRIFQAAGVVDKFSIDLNKLRSFLSALRDGYENGRAEHWRRSSQPNASDMEDSLTVCGPLSRVLTNLKLDEKESQAAYSRVRSVSSPEPQSLEPMPHNYYHNFRHAFDVLQMLFHMLSSSGLARSLDPLVVLSLLVSAIGHDLAHSGTTNAYHTACLSELAMVYNDRSVLENFHAACTFRILCHPSGRYNVLESLSEEQFRRARALIIGNILSTDMAQHGALMKQFKDRFVGKPLHVETKEDEQTLSAYLLHLCDIGNVARPFAISQRWTRLVCEEFFTQGDCERARGMAVTPMMDRTKFKSYADSVLGFIQFVVRDAFSTLAEAVPALGGLHAQLCDNEREWVRLKEQHSAK